MVVFNQEVNHSVLWSDSTHHAMIFQTQYNYITFNITSDADELISEWNKICVMTLLYVIVVNLNELFQGF